MFVNSVLSVSELNVWYGYFMLMQAVSLGKYKSESTKIILYLSFRASQVYNI